MIQTKSAARQGKAGKGAGELPGLTAKQWRAVSSPIRMELIAVAEAEQPCSIADLARTTGRRGTGLYRHVRILADAGFLARSGLRPGSRRPETLFSVTELAGRIGASIRNGTDVDRFVKLEQAVLRASGRGLRNMFLDHFRDHSGEAGLPRYHARHEITWIDETRANRLARLFEQLERIIEDGRRDRRGDLHQIDVLVWRRRVFTDASASSPKRRSRPKRT